MRTGRRVQLSGAYGHPAHRHRQGGPDRSAPSTTCSEHSGQAGGRCRAGPRAEVHTEVPPMWEFRASSDLDF